MKCSEVTNGNLKEMEKPKSKAKNNVLCLSCVCYVVMALKCARGGGSSSIGTVNLLRTPF